MAIEVAESTLIVRDQRPGMADSDNDFGARPVDLRARRAAAQTGVGSGEIERLPFDLSALEDEGLFADVDARNFGLLDRRLDWQALGITLPRGSDVAFRPPRCGHCPWFRWGPPS